MLQKLKLYKTNKKNLIKKQTNKKNAVMNKSSAGLPEGHTHILEGFN